MIDFPEEEMPKEGPLFYVLRGDKLEGPFRNSYEARMALNMRAIRSKWVRYKQKDLDDWVMKNRKLQ